MKEKIIIESAEIFIQNLTKNDNTGHDWEHNERVLKFAQKISRNENNINTLVVQLAAIFHDAYDWKIEETKRVDMKAKTVQWFRDNQIDNSIAKQVQEIIDQVSYMGPETTDKMISLEGQIVQDADRLDAMGYRGIERTLLFGDANNIPVINEYMPNMHLTKEEYSNFKRKENSAINHFFEKYLLIKKRLHTKVAKKIGTQLHDETKNYIRILLMVLKSLKQIKEDQYRKYIILLNDKIFI